MSIELSVIRQYRPILYLFFSQQHNYKYVVIGGASLEFLINNSFVVNTFDVDIHIWKDTLPSPSQLQEKSEMNKFSTQLETFFMQSKPLNEGINTYFEKLTSKMYFKSFIIRGTENNHPTATVTLYNSIQR